MTHSVWIDGQKIGETKFELRSVGRQRAGTFHATKFGLTRLPGITDMLPALVAFGEMSRREGIDVHDPRPETAAAALEWFAEAPEGKRVLAAAKLIADLVLQDSTGHLVVWQSIAISDVAELARMGGGRKMPSGQFIISATFAERQFTRETIRRLRETVAIES
jgi:hypothetical protein